MSNRLIVKLREIRKKHGKIFCVFLTLGYPSLQATERLILECEKAGVDLIELGIPFSDPLADGPTIQFSSEHALARGVSLREGLRLVSRLRQKGCRIPILCFSYLNPLYRFGLREFPRRARQDGFDGLIVPDLPPEEEPGLNRACAKAGLSQVFLVAPTTEPERASQIDRHTTGFIYYVSLRGVTGARKKLDRDIRADLARLRKRMRKPVLIGFGVSKPEQAHYLSGISQGVIVGSAVIDHIRKNKNRLDSVIPFIRRMVRATKHV